MSNADFEKFYRAQNLFSDEAEWQIFFETLRVILPTAFRITGNRSHAIELRTQIERYFIPYIQAADLEGPHVDPPAPLPWYPDQLGWQMTIPRIALKKSPHLRKFHTFLVTETEVGNISRQEAVSMIPPLLLDVKAGHMVIDMCAAPGSKTAQIVEAMHAEEKDLELSPGLVIANDANLKRACMLVHQMKRLHSPCLLVTHQDAEQFSNVLYPSPPEALRFDRILCDVPCSGDGTIRKNLLIWKDWKIADGMGIHGMQLKIAQRAAILLKVGGRMVYSTCSFNPLENEAVVAALLNSTDGALRLVDVSDRLPALVRRPGLTTWKVLRKDGEPAERFSDFAEEGINRAHSKCLPTLFPPANVADLHLDRCLRIYPHLQNTGGFFVAVLEKVKPLSKQDALYMETPAKAEDPPIKKPKLAPAEETTPDSPPLNDTVDSEVPAESDAKPLKDEPFLFVDPTDPDLESIWKFFEISEKLPRDQFLVRSEGSKQRTLYLVSSAIKSIMAITRNERLRVVNTGIRCFSRNDVENTPCTYRIHYEALPLLTPFLGDARKVRLTHPDLRMLLDSPNHLSVTRFSPALQERAGPMVLGCCIGYLYPEDAPEGHTMTGPMVFPIWRGVSSLYMLLGKQDKHSLVARVYGPDSVIETPKGETTSTPVDATPTAEVAEVTEDTPAV
ncbi:S-adenosyl-L-methionine-dependent methyltransferase [Dimargaris cristalligena]|uniref:S-adenosyl-L-methionine-dependent methyltransferase n=1 Tax=Dimargaris cristalligena TaxID=215637 RepID=A0A4P9ZSX0_9FUNG|nr:S-adenosyl-L-methionine-dependent methyltransferase [Dimargaris cristalligena]|eukprot:RKP36525.1 S-adenosyl-L-methionine-dependent methyltransferase [Dimargaris cristalligena]